MIFKAVLFDFGGVLVRTHDYSGRRKWEEKLGLEKGGLERVVFNSDTALEATLGRVGYLEVWRFVAKTFHLSDRDLEELRHDFWRGDRLDQELVNFAGRLRPNDVTAVVSNAWSNARKVFEEKYLLNEAFDRLFISAEISLAKPDQRVYHLVARELGVSPTEAIFVDDVAQNVEAASAVGMVGIRYESTPQVTRKIQDLLGIRVKN
ncbi:MAG TPA: HAD family phosphatase [Anaerolineaceae bacterium]|nr:HAD family phosphatase [Anaerolineaceae bacterium]